MIQTSASDEYGCPPVHGSVLSFTSSRGTQAVTETEMENTREGDGFQQAGGEKGKRKGESGPGQTSEGKQKLMKQDVTIDGSLHPSKHGTLAVLTLIAPLFLSLFVLLSDKELQNVLLPYTFSLLLLRQLSSQYNKPLQLSVAVLLIGPLISTYTCLRLQVNWIRSYNEPGCWISTQQSTLGHKPAQIRWIQLRVFTLNSTCIQYLFHSAFYCTHPVAHYHDCESARRSEQRHPWCHINGSRTWDQKATLIYKSLVWEFNSKAQPLLLVLKLTHYLVTLHTMSISHSHWPHLSAGPIRTWRWRKMRG